LGVVDGQSLHLPVLLLQATLFCGLWFAAAVVSVETTVAVTPGRLMVMSILLSFNSLLFE
jgi:hypothetical protein